MEWVEPVAQPVTAQVVAGFSFVRRSEKEVTREVSLRGTQKEKGPDACFG